MFNLIIDDIKKIMPAYNDLISVNSDEAEASIWHLTRQVKNHKVVHLYHAACAAMVLGMGTDLLGILY